MRFAQTTETLGVSFINSVMTLIAFLPLLWGLSRFVKDLPLVGAVPQALVIVAVVWSVLGTGALALAGIRLPGLTFMNQRVEAAYRKELVHGEDEDPVGDLFERAHEAVDRSANRASVEDEPRRRRLEARGLLGDDEDVLEDLRQPFGLVREERRSAVGKRGLGNTHPARGAARQDRRRHRNLHGNDDASIHSLLISLIIPVRGEPPEIAERFPRGD